MDTKYRDHHRTTTMFAFVSVLLLLLYPEQGHAETERNRMSNQFININTTSSKCLKTEECSSPPLPEECKIHFRNWMKGISPTIFPENATLVVDWSELDRKLLDTNCTYTKLL